MMDCVELEPASVVLNQHDIEQILSPVIAGESGPETRDPEDPTKVNALSAAE
tara:strand:- start:69 stop:224 length:156 start_codon:yes stop_codon:yes gene_type:complete